jgi:hypothetical protein
MEYIAVRALIVAAKARPSSATERALLGMDALPIPWSWEGCFGVRSNGDVVFVDDNANARPLTNPREERLATLAYAARRHPELVCLLPERPPSAISCRLCAGAGVMTKAALPCGDCFGLGWTNAA